MFHFLFIQLFITGYCFENKTIHSFRSPFFASWLIRIGIFVSLKCKLNTIIKTFSIFSVGRYYNQFCDDNSYVVSFLAAYFQTFSKSLRNIMKFTVWKCDTTSIHMFIERSKYPVCGPLLALCLTFTVPSATGTYLPLLGGKQGQKQSSITLWQSLWQLWPLT